jgi:peptidoglycan/LPS O-acetylase OafA/YrhL
VSSGPLSSTAETLRDTRAHLPRLDLLRGLTAAYVAAYHCVDILTASGRKFHEPGGAARMVAEGNPAGLLGFGHYAVLLFFLLSGFSIHLSESRRPPHDEAGSGRSWLRSYAIKRLLRIYPPLLVALFVTYALTRFGFHHLGDLFTSSAPGVSAAGLNHLPPDISNALTILVPVMHRQEVGANPVFWSVDWEILFYCAYVPLFVALRRARRPATVVFAWAAVLIEVSRIVIELSGSDHVWLARYSSIASYFPVWLLGAALAELYKTHGTLPVRARHVVFASGGIGIFMLSWSADGEFRPEYDYLWAVALAALFVGFAFAQNQRSTRLGRELAASSYSLYLIHVPLLLVLFGIVTDGTSPLTNPLTIATIWVATLAAGWVMAWCVERPSIKLAKRWAGSKEC